MGAALVVLAVALVVLCALPTSVFAEEPAAKESDAPTAPSAIDAELLDLHRKTLGASPYTPLGNFIEAGHKMISPDGLFWMATSAALVVGAHQINPQVQDHFNGKRRLGDWDTLGNDYLGTGVPGALLGAGFWLAGDLLERPYMLHAGQAQIETLFATGIITAVLKGSLGRERPDQSDRYSLPSGHTSTVFASATVLSQFYGWRAGIPAYFLAGLTAAGRWSKNRHWFSDTVAGASLGILVGQAVSRAHFDRMEAVAKRDQARFRFFPVLVDGGGQLMMRIEH